MQIYRHDEPFITEGGQTIPWLEVAYDTWGRLNAAGDNAIWVCHALTANSDVADWWPGTVVAGGFLDPAENLIICANILGSHYGTTGPLTPMEGGEPRYDRFPDITVRDMVKVHQLLAQHLGIKRVKLLIGSSLGGFQCMEWALMEPDFARNVALIATTPVTKPWAAAFNESQRMAIQADPTYGENSPHAGATGLAVARSLALLSYRGPQAYDLTQADQGAETEPGNPFKRRVHSYQRHQGEKLRARFNAYSYDRLSKAVDSHDIGRGRGGIEKALQSFKPRALIVAISSDILFPPSDHTAMAELIPDAQYHVIDSDFGHDGFLIENEKLTTIIKSWLPAKN